MFFPTTHWTELAKATLNGQTEGRAALEEFCRDYREPLLQFIHGRGIADPEAEDITHEFLLHVIQSSSLRRASPARGKFRPYLLASLVHFLCDAADRRNALKRGGGAEHTSLDAPTAAEPAAEPSPEDALKFDRAWAVAILKRALDRIADEESAKGDGHGFTVLRQFLPGDAPPLRYESGAAELGLSEGAFRSQVHRLRARFRALLREEVAATVSAPHEIDDEMRHLQNVLMDRGNHFGPAAKPEAAES